MPEPVEVNLICRIALGDMIRRRARSHGNKEGVVEYVNGNRSSLTYKEFNDRLNQFVNALRAHGIKQGDRVAIIGSNSSAFLIALMGSFKGGFVTVPVNYFQNPDDIRYNIEHSGARAIFADSGFLPHARKISCCPGGTKKLVGGSLGSLPRAAAPALTCNPWALQ
jgi:long-chain acyl-CoA synthetase